MKKKREENPIVNQVLTPEFLKQFKDSGELNTFMENLYARAREQMIEGELDGHLGYEKHSQFHWIRLTNSTARYCGRLTGILAAIMNFIYNISIPVWCN